MKKTKLSNTQVPDYPISQEEKDLLAHAFTDVRSLASDAQLFASHSSSSKRPQVKAINKQLPLEQQQGPSLYKCQLSVSDHCELVGALQELSFHRTSDTKVLMSLKSGKRQTQAVIDLHGLRLEQAAQELSMAMTDWLRRGLRVVRIVHGKGKKQGYSVIKSHIPYWLDYIPQVLAYSSCRQEDGGTGAVVLLLKKAQKNQQRFEASDWSAFPDNEQSSQPLY